MAVVDENTSTSRGFVDGLFPPDTSPRGRLVTGHVLAFVAAVGFQLLTPAGLSRLDRVWAEDGARFLLDAVTQPFAADLVAPYGGYLHTVPRLFAELASVLPLEWASVVVAVSAAALRAVVALIAFGASAGYLRSAPVRFALASLVVVLPAGNSEPLDNLANVHWFLLYGVFWALLWRSGPRVPIAVFVVLATLSSPLALFLAPIALLRLAAPARDRVVPIAFLVAVAVQASAMTFAERAPYSNDPVDPVQVVLAGLLRVPVVAFIGSEPVNRIYPAFGNLPVVVALLLAVVPIVAGLRWGDRAGRFLVVLGAVCSVLVIAVSLTVNWSVALQVQKPEVVMAAQRYSIAPCLFLFTAMAVGVDAGLGGGRLARLTVRAGRALVTAAVLIGIALHFTWSAGILDGRPWDVGVAEAKAECAAGVRPVGRIVHEPDGWFFELPCEYLAE